jgi:hypothetical protein
MLCQYLSPKRLVRLLECQHAEPQGTEGVLVPLPPFLLDVELGDHLRIGDGQLQGKGGGKRFGS